MSDTSHWRQIDPDPNGVAVREHLLATVRDVRRGTVVKTRMFEQFVAGRTTLDIGVVAHQVERTRTSGWKHDLIRSSASRTVGIDIVEEGVRELVARGYDVRLVDATSDTDLGERFERVVIGDVIEHVDQPVRLLQFAERHLAPGGAILASTPNPYFVGNIVAAVRDGTFVANAEHVSWITPTMALELAHRAGLELQGIWQTQGEGASRLRKVALALLQRAGQRDSELFCTSYGYVFGRPGESE